MLRDTVYCCCIALSKRQGKDAGERKIVGYKKENGTYKKVGKVDFFISLTW